MHGGEGILVLPHFNLCFYISTKPSIQFVLILQESQRLEILG